MILSQACLWPLVALAGGTVVAATLRCLTLFIGLRLTLHGAPSDQRLPIYREFARALSFTPRLEEHTSRRPAERPAAMAPVTVSRQRRRGHTRFLRRPKTHPSGVTARMVHK
ncbi:hypothetical protein OG417_11875 [Actinoallomurus sp. NBC_01490]|uniref:hypothetical protein n=1 Tax=Actinoallomurus sp. NBC_01490 TaxID=2903557 RepID=UPI002E320F81|nr:hypothetical protein [Actinoallomurus sp. NBC_01490]